MLKNKTTLDLTFIQEAVTMIINYVVVGDSFLKYYLIKSVSLKQK